MGSTRDEAPRRYEIKLAGCLGPAFAAAFRDMHPQIVPRQTVIRARLSDVELAELLRCIDELGLSLVAVRAE